MCMVIVLHRFEHKWRNRLSITISIVCIFFFSSHSIQCSVLGFRLFVCQQFSYLFSVSRWRSRWSHSPSAPFVSFCWNAISPFLYAELAHDLSHTLTRSTDSCHSSAGCYSIFSHFSCKLFRCHFTHAPHHCICKYMTATERIVHFRLYASDAGFFVFCWFNRLLVKQHRSLKPILISLLYARASESGICDFFFVFVSSHFAELF